MLGKLPSSTFILQRYNKPLAFLFKWRWLIFSGSVLSGEEKMKAKDRMNVFKYLEGHVVEKGGEFILDSSRSQHSLGRRGEGMSSLKWSSNWLPVMEKLPTSEFERTASYQGARAWSGPPLSPPPRRPLNRTLRFCWSCGQDRCWGLTWALSRFRCWRPWLPAHQNVLVFREGIKSKRPLWYVKSNLTGILFFFLLF